jgi:exportin-2 (importin alpha re-exporter)
MEINEQNLTTITNYLQQTMSSDMAVRQQSENMLKSLETTQHFLILLMKLFELPTLDLQIRMAAAILFKNCIKKHWRQIEGSPDVIPETDRITIKTYIVDLMLHTPILIQKQLSESLTIVADNDFPKKWENLLEELVRRITNQDFRILNGVLQTAHSIFKR